MKVSMKAKAIAVFMTLVLVLVACSGNGNGNQGGNGNASGNAGGGTSEGAQSNFNAEGMPILNEPVTLKMMGWRHPIQGPWEEMIFFEEMANMTNIHFEFDTPPAEGYDERKNLTFVGGDLPDVFFGGMLTPMEEVKYGAQGVLIPLEGLIQQYAPNIQAMFEEMPEIKQSITAPDGHIYSLPNINRASIAVTFPAWVNGEWLEALGITELPTTTEEFYDMLVRFRDEDPNGNGEADEIPITSHDKLGDIRHVILPAFGVLLRGVEVKDGVVRHGAMEEGYREYLAYMNRLWSERLIDQDAFTQGHSEMTAKGMNNQVGLFMHAGPFLGYDVQEPEDNLKYPVLPVLTSEYNPDPVTLITSGINRGVFAITNQNPYPEATIRWVDYLYSLEGSIFLHYGPENDLWEFADRDAGIRRYIQPDNGMNVEEYRGTLTPDVGTPTPKWVRDEVERGWDDIGHEHRFAETEAKLMPYAREPFPMVYYTVEEQERLEVLNIDLSKYIEEMEARFITGAEPLSNWDNYVETLQRMGIEEVIEINQAAYDRWVEAR